MCFRVNFNLIISLKTKQNKYRMKNDKEEKITRNASKVKQNMCIIDLKENKQNKEPCRRLKKVNHDFCFSE